MVNGFRMGNSKLKFLVLLFLLFFALSGLGASKEKLANNRFKSVIQTPDENVLLKAQGNALLPISSPVFQKSKTYPDPLGQGNIKELVASEYSRLFSIVFCESSFRPEACSFAGCHSGIGLVGFIPSTWNLTLEKMKKAGAELPSFCDVKIVSTQGFLTNKKHPVFNPECNLKVGIWLLENEGSSHWNSSQKCWEKH